MKKTIITFSFLLACCYTNAQDIKFGVRAGINIANVTIKASGVSVSGSSLIGPNAGVFAEIPLAPTVFVQPEVAYSGMGYKISVSSGGQTVSGKSTVNYLTIPLLVKVKIPTTGLAVYAGPQYGYLLGGKETGDAGEGEQSNDAKDSYKSSDIAGIIGAEYFFISRVGLSARYQFGLSNVAKGAGEDESAKNHGFTILLAVKL